MEIKLNNLKKIYNGVAALDIPSLDIKSGELVGLVGNNGAGKTTMLKLMLDLIEADSGYVSIDGQEVSKTVAWKEFTGSYIDGRFLIDYLTPEEYFSFIADVYGISDNDMKERLGAFDNFMHGEIMGKKKYLRDFSQGNRQKIGIIGAMVIRPKILLLDEPFNFLDPSSQMIIARMIKAMCHDDGTTVVLSSHNLSYVSDISTRILLLEKGLLLKDLANTSSETLSELNAYFGSEAEED